MSPIGESLIKNAVGNANAPAFTPPGVGDADRELLEIVKGLKLKIKIIGCGGGGCNTINRLLETGVMNAEVIAANTDASHLLQIRAHKKILLGRYTTRGLGAGARPEVGEEAARESEDQLREVIDRAHIVIVTAGLGGGTGTGSAPFVARLAREMGALVIGVVTLPFSAEGKVRMSNAMRGLEKMKRACDTTIVIPNDKLLELVPNLPINDAFMVADEILMRTIKGITETLTKPGLVNLDFNDLKTIMKNGGMAMVGLGESDDPDRRAEEAVEEALNSPLVSHLDITTAKGALVKVEGGPDMTIKEAETAAEMVHNLTGPNTKIIWGCSVDPSLEKTIRVMIVLTGVEEKRKKLGADEHQRAGPPVKKIRRGGAGALAARRPVVSSRPVAGPTEEEVDLGIDIID